jgi:hypothetical protein
VFRKPIHPAELLACVRGLLGQGPRSVVLIMPGAGPGEPLKAALEEAGWTVRLASRPEDAKSALAADPRSLVVFDLRPAGAEEVQLELWADAPFHGLPSVLLAPIGNAGTTLLVDCAEGRRVPAGPFTPQALAKHLLGLLNRPSNG